MSLREVMGNIYSIQRGLSISDPEPMVVKKVWKYVPPSNKTLTDVPCWMNTWDLDNAEWLPGNMREVQYNINMKLAVGEATSGQDRLADIATAFWEETLKAFRNDVMLGGTNRIQKLRGGGPTLAVIEFGGMSYVGLNLWLDILVVESNT